MIPPGSNNNNKDAADDYNDKRPPEAWTVAITPRASHAQMKPTLSVKTNGIGEKRERRKDV